MRQMSACTPYTAVLAQRPVANIGPAVAEAWIEMTGGGAELHAIVAQAGACPSARADGRSLPLVRRTEPKDPSPDFPSTCQLSLPRHLKRLSLGTGSSSPGESHYASWSCLLDGRNVPLQLRKRGRHGGAVGVPHPFITNAQSCQ